ncbi:TcfC E-set like domain-containing protein [Iodobacter fluviatilis]|uniref:Fimbrial outer membrane usher protein TcfC n=1 Tax=Iodobacter fluviatilis TaxID=537 RepID=A0A7G3GCD6_9NEIS|nr:TcfC E-set like domain-containing protein [Iodobacter fluviatilis]QBC44315.1 hypothetical protein C1H71_12780 [Iodobacter fluviatilis]
MSLSQYLFFFMMTLSLYTPAMADLELLDDIEESSDAGLNIELPETLSENVSQGNSYFVLIENIISDAGPARDLAVAGVIPVTPSALNQLLIPEEIREFLSDGVTLDLYLKNIDDETEELVPFASLSLVYQDQLFLIKNISLKPERKVRLTAASRTQLMGAIGKSLDQNGGFNFGSGMRMQIDIETMKAFLEVSQQNFGLKDITRTTYLGDSSVKALGNIFNYGLNAYASNSNDISSHSAYLNFNNVTSLGEQHLFINGDLTSNSDDSAFNLDELVYERDFAGRRLALGMLSGWSLQSLGNVSTLSGEQMYGFSYGNVAKSAKHDSSQSLTPITVYLPSSGEVRVLRDGKLLSSQRFPLGSHELDASRLPGGIYDVELEVVVGGKVVSSRRQQINKSYNTNANGNELAWQVWGGAAKKNQNYDYSNNAERDNDFEPLYGISLAAQEGMLSWSGSVYHNQNTLVVEASPTLQINEDIRLDLQTLYGSDGLLRNMANLNLNIPGGWGSLWAGTERGHEGKTLPMYIANRNTFGASLALANLHQSLGSVSLSFESDLDEQQKYIRADYSHNINMKYATASMQVGVNHYINNSDHFNERDTQYFANVNLSFPMDSDFRIGVSTQGNDKTLDLSAAASLDGVINRVGADISTSLGGENSQTNYGAYANYRGRYAEGSVSFSGSDDTQSISLTNNGSFVMGDGGIVAGRGDTGAGSAAVVVNMPEIGADDLEANINGQRYPLSSGKNLITLPAYDDYSIQVNSTDDANSSYQIQGESLNYNLYPGNIVEITPGVKQMVTVFGRLTTENGKPLRGVSIKNHIGETVTNETGNFAIDVDIKYPEVKAESEETGLFDVKMKLNADKSVVWLGEVVWRGKEVKNYNVSPPL